MCTRCDAVTISFYLTTIGLVLDIDGSDLTTGAIGSGCSR